TYMVAGRGTPDQAPARLLAYRDPTAFETLINILVEASSAYLARQFDAGVHAAQIFDTWAGVLSGEDFDRWCIAPLRRIVANVRKRRPDARIIGFPRGAGSSLPRYVVQTGVDAVGLDWMIDRTFAREQIQSRRTVQGNLDPLVLLAGGAALDRAVDDVLGAVAQKAFLFNLGAGAPHEARTAPDAPMTDRGRGRTA